MENSLPIKEQDVELTSGGLWANIWRMSWPMLLIMLFNFLVGMTDIYIAGFIGPEVQAAVGFVGQIYFLTILIANAVSIGTVALLSRAIGARNLKGALDIAGQSLAFSVLAALVLMLAGIVFHGEIISLAGFPAGLREIAKDFLKIFSLAIGPNYVLIISNAIFRAGGEVRKMLFTMFLVSAVNIALNFILVFGIPPFFSGIGYKGIALSTAASMVVGMIINFTLLSSGRWKPVFTESLVLHPEIMRNIVDISWPAALLQIAWNAGSLVLYNILGRLGSASITSLAALTNGLRIEAVIYLPAFALNMAASVLVGQNLGARNAERAEKVGWKTASAGVVFISVMALVIFLLAGRLASFVAKSPGVVEETTRYLRINMLSEPFMALSTVLGGGLQGAGDTRGTMWVVIIAMWLIRIPLAYLFALTLGYGAVGVWAAMVTSMTFQGIFMAYRFHNGLWKRMRIG